VPPTGVNFTGSSQPGATLKDMRELILVTTDDCRFCERAHAVLDALGVEARHVPVASREAEGLAARGIPLAFLPVLTDGERVLAYGRFSKRRLRKELGMEPVA